ncbi:MAG: hypothetical protein AAF797_05100 [Planctomycetota bacterium]
MATPPASPQPDPTRATDPDDGTYALGPVPDAPQVGSGSILGLTEHTIPTLADSPVTPKTSGSLGPAIERCARCGYDLTGLALTTACPECGSNERRIDTAQRPAANAGWLKLLNRGIQAAWAAITFALIVSFARLIFGQGWHTAWLGGAPADYLLMEIAKLIGAVALFLLTQPNPALLGPGSSPTDQVSDDASHHPEAPRYSKFIWPAPPRQLARWGAATFAVGQLLVLACWLHFSGQLDAIGFAAGVVGGITLFAGLTHLADVFDQFGQDQQAFETRILRFGWLGAVLGSAFFFLVLPAFQPTPTTRNAMAAVLVLLIVVMLFWSLTLLIHLGQASHARLHQDD